jgi:hypothetical protein
MGLPYITGVQKCTNGLTKNISKHQKICRVEKQGMIKIIDVFVIPKVKL